MLSSASHCPVPLFHLTLFVVPSIYVLVARSHATVPVEEERTVPRGRELAEAAS